MAEQHLYSRVPARLSIYNKTDGYDTFACSSGLTRTYIDDEISKVYDNKPTKEDALLIQDGKLPPVYCQHQAEDGKLIQSCVSYLTQDYTGERSSYMVHSLIVDGKEKDGLLSSPVHKMLNPDMFMTTVASEDLTSLNSPFSDSYPETEYKNADVGPTAELTKQYNPELLRRLIYAFLSVASGKTKGVFIMFNSPVSELSAKCLGFLNTFIQIFPYHIRPVLSFVTYAGDITKYASFKVRCMPKTLRDIPTTKGMSVNFAANETTGISDNLMEANSDVVDFFFSLLENDAVRKEFLRFADEATAKMPALAKPTLNNICDTVLLFRQCSGLYSDAEVLPNDDRVYDFVSTYDKYREALSDEFRASAFRFLSRYPQRRVAIPKNVFAKISSVYPKEPNASKRVIMNTMLDFIHIDVMRDKLFTFMKNNYADEDETTKSTIVEDLSRVYYGGFLQTQILGFFDGCFTEASEKSKDQIVEKLLLTLRTKNVQGQVTEILDRHYADMTENEKNSFYEEFYKMLPEGDELTVKLIGVVDNNITSEDDEFRRTVAGRICTITENDQRRKEPRIISVMAERDGFCSDTVMHRLFFDWSGRKAFTEYWTALWKRPLTDRIARIVSVFRSFPDLPAETVEKMTSCIKELFAANSGRYALSALTDSYTRLKTELPGSAKQFSDEICGECLLPLIGKSVSDAFAVTNGASGISRLEQFAKDNPEVRSLEQYASVENYLMLKKALEDGDADTAVAKAAELNSSSVRAKAADALESEVLKSGMTLSDGARMTALLTKAIFKGNCGVSDCYRVCRQAIEKELISSGQESETMKQPNAADERAINALIDVGSLVYATEKFGAEKEKLFGTESELSAVFAEYCDANGKNARKTIEDKLRSLLAEQTDYINAVKAALDSVKPARVGLFQRLFGKK